MSVEKDALVAMARARRVARHAVAECLQRKEDAYVGRNFEEFDRAAVAYRDALNAEDQAARRLIAALSGPTEGDVRTLASAADALEARVEAMKASAAKMSDVAVGITILTHAILLFSMV